MLLSAEIRWYWQGRAPGEVEQWFGSGPFPPARGAVREDMYLRDPAQQELGIKRRGGRTGVEIKGLVAKLMPAPEDSLGAAVEIWCKWSTESLDLEGREVVTLHKERRLRTFDLGATGVREVELDAEERPRDSRERLPDDGCTVELTRVTIVESGEAWSSLGCEAFGSLATVAANLKRTVAHLELRADLLGDAQPASYPAWLARVSS